MRHRLPAFLCAALLMALGVAACGEDSTQQDSSASPGESTTAPASTTGSGAAIEVTADPDGDLGYEQMSLTAAAGMQTFAFDNPATVPHDFKIEKDGSDVAGTNVISEDSENLSTTLEAGEYQFYCSVAGHRSAGMEGTLSVK